VILFTAKWDRKPEEVRVSAGDTELFLLQYQADGSTGLARGGHSFEDAVVLAVRAPRPIKKVEQVEFVATSAKDSSGRIRTAPDAGGKPVPKPIVKRKSVAYEGEATRCAFDGLEEGEWTWSAALKGADWEGARAEQSPGKPDFLVFRGLTEPIALALAGPYLLAFEVVSVLLLAALVGAAFLARKEVRET
jgi:hypothetical protein